MRYVSATDAKQTLAAVLDAAQREPVVIQRQKRDVAVVLSVREYEKLVALNIEEFQRFCDQVGERAAARGLTEDGLAALLTDAR
ncbi:MAG: type II toxin-antitoxin system Phd/YefM family antitoxin [Rhodospirillales bacterium]